MAASRIIFSVFFLAQLAVTLATPLAVLANEVPVQRMQRVIGIVEIPSIFGVANPKGPPGSRHPFSPAPVSVYDQPGSGIVTVIKTRKAIATAEYSYEQAGALVYDRKNNWYLIGIDNISGKSRAWLGAANAGRYHSLEGLLKQGLPYLTRSWDSRLAQAPAGKAVRYNGKARDIKVIEKRVVNQETWFHIELLQPGPCDSSSPKVVVRGWIPAYTADGHMNVWFYSRGC